MMRAFRQGGQHAMPQPKRKTNAAQGRRRPGRARRRRARVRADRPRGARPGAVGEAHRRHAEPAGDAEKRRLHRRRHAPGDRGLRPAGVRPHHLLREMDPGGAQPRGRAGDPDARGDRGAHGRGEGALREGRAARPSQGRRSRGESDAPRQATTHPRQPVSRPAMRCASADRPVLGHCRTPWYLRGKTGVIASMHGTFRDPELLAYHRPGSAGAGALQGAVQAERDLGPLRRPAQRPARGRHLRALARACGRMARMQKPKHADHDDHDHDDHDHDHDHDHGDHPHAPRRRITTRGRPAPTRCWRRPCARC